MCISAFLNHGLGIRHQMILAQTTTRQHCAWAGRDMLSIVLGLSQLCLQGPVPVGDTGGEVSGAIIPPGRFVKSFLSRAGGS